MTTLICCGVHHFCPLITVVGNYSMIFQCTVFIGTPTTPSIPFENSKLITAITVITQKLVETSYSYASLEYNSLYQL